MKYISLITALLLSACASYTPKQREENTQKLNAFFERVFNENISRSPIGQTYIGLKTNYDKLNNNTEEYALESFNLMKDQLEQLKKFPFEGLTEQGQLSYRLFKNSIEECTIKPN